MTHLCVCFSEDEDMYNDSGREKNTKYDQKGVVDEDGLRKIINSDEEDEEEEKKEGEEGKDEPEKEEKKDGIIKNKMFIIIINALFRKMVQTMSPTGDFQWAIYMYRNKDKKLHM